MFEASHIHFKTLHCSDHGHKTLCCDDHRSCHRAGDVHEDVTRRRRIRSKAGWPPATGARRTGSTPGLQRTHQISYGTDFIHSGCGHRNTLFYYMKDINDFFFLSKHLHPRTVAPVIGLEQPHTRECVRSYPTAKVRRTERLLPFCDVIHYWYKLISKTNLCRTARTKCGRRGHHSARLSGSRCAAAPHPALATPPPSPRYWGTPLDGQEPEPGLPHCLRYKWVQTAIA